MVIQHNMHAMFSQRQLGITTDVKKKSTEKLSSGYRINRAADDAAGLAISEKMRRQIRGMSQNLDNIQDGVSFCQVADGYLQEVHDMVQRVNELGVKGANDTLTDDDREYINMEVQEIKDEMQRIFDVASFNEMAIFRVPYSPTVVPHDEPYDTQIFYSSAGQIGGLEFNNVRYNISELNSKGMSLDSNGVATADQKVEFTLYDGELVKLSLSAGQSLAQVRREYDWKADGTGIYVNDKLATTWTALGVTGNGHDAGLHTFDYHGMSVGFTIPEGDTLADIQVGINGNGITTSSFWDIGVSSTTSRPIIDYVSYGTQTANQSNAGYFDHNYVLTASTTGLSLTDTTDGTGTTSVNAWSSFRNVGGAIPQDETGSNYPIVDWGIDNDGNDASQITFDTEARYRYTSSNSNMPVSFDFKLADVSSQSEVINSANNTTFTNTITCPANLSYRGNSSGTTTTDGSSMSISSIRITGNNNSAYALQRAYGRNFDTNAALSGNISWTTEYVAGSETDHSTPINRYTEEKNRTSSDSGPTDFYYHDDATDTYWKYQEVETTTVVDYQINETYAWTKQYNVKYQGELGSANMKEFTDTETIGYSRYKSDAYSTTSVNYTYSNAEQITDPAEIIDAGNTFENSFKTDPAPVDSAITNVSDTTSVNSGTFTKSHNFVRDGESSNSNYAFSFRHSISHQDMVDGTSGQTNITLSFTAPARRTFRPITHSDSVSEYDFNDITVHAPEKKLIIQASPDSELIEQIELKWSALNLNALGMAGTNTLTASASKAAIDQAKAGIKKISEERGKFGAMQNRCEHAYKEVANARENTQYSESIIRDTDMAKEMVKLSNHNVLEQAGQTMLAQANQTKQGVLSLLQ